MSKPPLSRIDRRFDRQFKALARRFPRFAGPLGAIRNPMLWLVRLPLAILLILGGFLAVLPVFGLWMIPVGLLLLAVDIPQLKGPVAATMIRARRRVEIWRSKLTR